MKLAKLLLGLITAAAAQVASAGVITIFVDDFNYAAMPGSLSSNWSLPSGGTWTWDSVTPPGSASLVQSYADGSKFVVNTPDGVTYQATLTYGFALNYASDYGGSNGQLHFMAVTSDQAGNSIGGSIIPAIGSSGPAVAFTLPYANGAPVALAFNGSPVKAWDVSIDSVSVSFDCSALESGTYTLEGLNAALGKRNGGSCVPVSGSLSLLGLGGVVAALMARRRLSTKA